MANVPNVPNADLAITRYGQAGRDWIAGTQLADPLADAVVADFATLPRGAGMAMFRAALQHGIDAVESPPESLRALFDEIDHEPDWLDHDRLDRAAGHIVRHTASYGIVLGAASLTSGAMNAAAGMPLVLTGRYTSQAAVRSIEVGAWLEEILTPGGLRRHGAGVATTLRVRIIHAFVRRHLLAEGDWNNAAWGAPIPQSYMAFTIVEFGRIALAAMHQLGVRYKREELDDIYHFWRYVGRLNGVAEELNPATEADQIRIAELYALTAVEPDKEDRDFVRALTHDYLAREIAELLPFAGSWKHRLGVNIISGMTRAFLGDANASRLGVADTPFKYLPRVLGPAFGGVNQVLARIPGVNELRTRRALANYPLLMAQQRQRYGVHHDLVDAAPDNGGHPAAVRSG
ncbi:oxygenase MpaB family protein [Mycobacterium sp. UM_Kg27]|uniref:oxygenase MpaB family protein n=1 Tax=Mycobacterium sp. UM_Kg27 TaxID=1545693 RepID=UPI00061B5572|nr:oxygenase MpaB family protein [Mycobacterium sp. UM_Kg27]